VNFSDGTIKPRDLPRVEAWNAVTIQADSNAIRILILATAPIERHLAAIVAADVVGYSLSRSAPIPSNLF
jgi:hypothetical protein